MAITSDFVFDDAPYFYLSNSMLAVTLKAEKHAKIKFSGFKISKLFTLSTVELKEKLISKILHTDSLELLGEVFRLLEIESEAIKVIKLSDQHKQAISKGQEDIANERFLTNEQANREIERYPD